MKLSIRKKMLMLGGICLVSMLITFGIFYYNNLQGSEKIAQITKNLINKEINCQGRTLNQIDGYCFRRFDQKCSQ